MKNSPNMEPPSIREWVHALKIGHGPLGIFHISPYWVEEDIICEHLAEALRGTPAKLSRSIAQASPSAGDHQRGWQERRPGGALRVGRDQGPVNSGLAVRFAACRVSEYRGFRLVVGILIRSL